MNIVHELEQEILHPKEGYLFVSDIGTASLIANVILNKIEELGFDIVEKESKEYSKCLFTIEGYMVNMGYHNGNSWNGFACPYFTKEVAIKILDEVKERGGYDWYYDNNTDTFYTVDYLQSDNESKPGLKEEFNGKDIIYNNETIHVYDVGTGSWTWDIVNIKRRVEEE